MKTIKKHISWGVCLLMLFATSCSNETPIENSNSKESNELITLNASINNASGLRMTYEDGGKESGLKFNWSTNEKFNVYKGTDPTAYEFSKQTEGNAFSGYRSKGGQGKYYAVYGENIENNNGKLDIDISQQNANISAENAITTFMVAESEVLLNTINFNHKLAVLKLTLTLPADVTATNIEKVILSGLHNKASYTLEDGSYTYGKPGEIIATNGGDGFPINVDNHSIIAYVAVFPENVIARQLFIRVEIGDDIYIYTITTPKKINAATVIPINVTMVKLEYVDIGWPQDAVWATMNVGANKPEEVGNLYAYGETEPKTSYTEENYMCSEKEYGTDADPLKSYFGTTCSGSEFDVAHVKWGGKWVMPTANQFEGVQRVTREDTILENGVKCLKLISTDEGTKGNFIILPIQTHNIPGISGNGDCGLYHYMGQLSSGDASNVCYQVALGADQVRLSYSGERWWGAAVRPIIRKSNLKP